jgi:hypothetical protein
MPEESMPLARSCPFDSKLRGGDIVSGGQIRTRAIVIKQKKGRLAQFKLLPAVIFAIQPPPNRGLTIRRNSCVMIGLRFMIAMTLIIP